MHGSTDLVQLYRDNYGVVHVSDVHGLRCDAWRFRVRTTLDLAAKFPTCVRCAAFREYL